MIRHTHWRTILCLTLLVGLFVMPTSQAATKSKLQLPGTGIQLGLMNAEGGAGDLQTATKVGLRYHYLSGGANTGSGWSTWALGNGSFVSGYIADSVSHGFTPVFSYYQLRESAPGRSESEDIGVLHNLDTKATMLAYYNDLKLFFQRANGTNPVILHVEPDAWGYIQRKDNNPDNVKAAVASTGMSDLGGLPNTATGFAQAIVKLRNNYAPNVSLGYHLSQWGTGEDISFSDPSDSHIDNLANSSVQFYQALHANFDSVFAEFANQTAGYAQNVNGQGDKNWWNKDDFLRQERYLAGVSAGTKLPIILWQIPLGNTKMRAMNNTRYHYQDNRVEFLLDGSASRSHLRDYAKAGVVAFLFGAAFGDDTCACDGAKDGVTNPSPTNGNTQMSYNSDDDGGLFKQLARQYYTLGTIATQANIIKPGKPTKTTPKRLHFAVATSSPTTPIVKGSPLRVVTSVTANKKATAVVAVQLYAPGSNKIYRQIAYRNQRLSANKKKQYTSKFAIPSSAATGVWKVKVGVFDKNFKKLQQWNNDAASITVQ